MANKDYSYEQVRAGIYTYVRESNPQFSSGVQLLQTYLTRIGFRHKPDGLFDKAMEEEVISFQGQCKNIGEPDGKAGKSTLTMADKVCKNPSIYNSIYVQMGNPLPLEKWGRENIIKGVLPVREVLARIIFAEDPFIMDAQTAVALVMKHRTKIEGFMVKDSTADNFLRVVCCKGQYETANQWAADAITPHRFDINENNGINKLWDHAISLAYQLDLKHDIAYPEGYIVNIVGGKLKMGNAKKIMTDQVYQTAKNWCLQTVSSPRDILTFHPNFDNAINATVVFNP